MLPPGVVVHHTHQFLGQEQGYTGGLDPANREACVNSDYCYRRF